MPKSPIAHIYNSNAQLLFLNNYSPINLHYINEEEILKKNEKISLNSKYYFKETDNLKISLFPIIIQSDKKRWLESDLYFHYLIENNPFLSFKTLRTIANHLLHFLRFIEHKNLKITHSPKEKYKRVTYQFLNELEFLKDENLLNTGTINHRLMAMFNFYETCINNDFINKNEINYPLIDIVYQQYNFINPVGLSYSKKQKKIKFKKLTNNPNSNNKKYPGKRVLKPLLENDLYNLIKTLKNYDDYQFSLMCYIALFTGARIQTVCNIRAEQIKELFISNNKQKSQLGFNEYILNVGMNTNVGTKNNTGYKLLIPDFLVEKLYIYTLSSEWEKRASRLSFTDRNSPYLFITKHGNPYYSYPENSHNEDTSNKFYDGSAVRMKIRKLIQLIQEKFPEFRRFSFHDLRATFAVNFLHNMTLVGYDTNYSLHELKERLGHSDIESTLPYIKYYENKKKLEKINIDYQKILFNLDI